jgi:hypothetical protein
MSSSNLVKISSIEETVYGVTPTAGDFKTVRYTSESLSGTPQTAESTEIHSDRTAGGQVQVGLEVGGDINAELSADGTLTDFIRGAMMQTVWAEEDTDTNEFVINPIDKTISTDDSTLDVAIGDLLIISGATEEKNNGMAYVTAVEVLPNTPAVLKPKITAAPGANQWEFVFTVSPDTAGTVMYGNPDSTTGDLASGSSVSFTYPSAGTYNVTFTDANSVVSNLALNVVDADPVSQTGEDEILTPASGGRIFTVAKETIASETGEMTVARAARLSVGTDTVSFSISKEFADLTERSIAYRGMLVNQMSLSMAYGSIAESTFSFVGNGYDTPVSPITSGRTIAPADTDQPFNASSDIGLVIVGGAVADFCIQSLQITLANGLTPQTCMGSLAPRQYALGTAGITISGSAYLSDENWRLMTNKISQTPISIAYTVENEDGGFAVVVHGAQLSFPDPASGGMDQQVSIEFSGSAKAVESGYFDIYKF